MLRKQIKRTYLPISIASFPELNGKLANHDGIITFNMPQHWTRE